MKAQWHSPYRVPVLAITVVLAGLALWLLAAARHGNSVLQGVDLAEGARPDVKVFLPFEPESFHLEQFQDVGRYLGWHDDHAVIMAADPGALRHLAGQYWVTDVRPHEAAP